MQATSCKYHQENIHIFANNTECKTSNKLKENPSICRYCLCHAKYQEESFKNGYCSICYKKYYTMQKSLINFNN